MGGKKSAYIVCDHLCSLALCWFCFLSMLYTQTPSCSSNLPKCSNAILRSHCIVSLRNCCFTRIISLFQFHVRSEAPQIYISLSCKKSQSVLLFLSCLKNVFPEFALSVKIRNQWQQFFLFHLTNSSWDFTTMLRSSSCWDKKVLMDCFSFISFPPDFS